MITLRTKTVKNVPNEHTRSNEDAIVYLKINLNKVQPNIQASGLYYFIDSKGRIAKLDNFKPKTFAYAELEQLEQALPPLESDTNLIANIKQRCFEMAKFVIDQESIQGVINNYGITTSDDLELVE